MIDDSQLVASAVERLIAAGIRQRTALAKRLGCTTTEVLALHHVVMRAHSAPGDLARALLLSPSGATAVIDRLTTAGLISRAPAAGKQRVALTVTDAGRELYAQTLATYSHGLEDMIEDLPRPDRISLEQFLTRLADLAEREANALIARAEEDASPAPPIPPRVLWS